MFKKLLAPFQKYVDQLFAESNRKLDESKKVNEQLNKDLENADKILKKAEERQKKMISRLDNLDEKIEKFEWEKKASSQSQSAYISMLTSYTAHDLKNNLQNIDNILSFKSAGDITEDDLTAFKGSLRMIRESLDKFSELSLSSKDNEISTKSVASNVYHINLQEMTNQKIYCPLPSGDNTVFNASFFTITTMLNNILINAIKALSYSLDEEKKILLNYGKCEEKKVVWFKVYDNAPSIPEDIKDKIFEYGITSYIDGDGIGLSHAKDVCNLYNGKIEILKSDIIDYTKLFYIELPIKTG